MVDVQVMTINGTEHLLGDARIAEFQNRLRGQLIRPGDTDYDTARRLWNGNVDRRPALIVPCEGVADVINCVNFARDNSLLVSG